MATVAFGKACPNCGTLVTCVGDDSQAQLVGMCPCCKIETTYVLDPIAVARTADEAAAAERQANIAANAAAASATPPVPAQGVELTPPAGP